MIVRSDSKARISRNRDPYGELMRRIFQDNNTADRGQKFLMMVEERSKSGNPIRIEEWESIMKELDVGRSSFYAMRNKLLGAGLIRIQKGEINLSGIFSIDLMDIAKWWWTAVLQNDEESLKV